MVAGKIIYFDNAATSYPKPEVVYQTQDATLRSAGNPGRGAHRLALDSARAVFESRSEIAQFLGIDCPERLVFTPGCTYSINTILRGFPFRQGDGSSVGRGKELPTVIASPLEHNAVMRPLNRLEKEGVLRVHRLKYAAGGVIDLRELKEAVKELKPALCVVQEGSNVTGELVDINSVWEVCQAAKASLLIDAAQSAGSIPSCLPQLSASLNATADDGRGFFWCASGHKGLLGPPGIGLLFIGAKSNIEPLVAGGTGSNSENLEMPVNYPDRLESGTQPVHLIDALAKGVSWLKQQGIVKLREHEVALTYRFLAWCDKHSYIKVFGNRTRQGASTSQEASNRAGLPIVSFTVNGVSTDQVADLLDREFDIAVRSGLHCAMAAHQSLGTLKTGLTRASFGYFNTGDEVDELCKALESIYKKRGQ
jgi:selenocysteine lyase/cysteine desulfurase